MERKIIHVVGTGTIGEPLIGLLCDFQDQLGIDEITFHKNSALNSDHSKVVGLIKRGGRLCVDSNKVDDFKALDLDPDFETEDAIERASVVIDCTPRGIGHKNKELYYQKFDRKEKGFLAQGSENGFGKKYARGINDSTLHPDNHFVQVVSCNTHNLCCITHTLALSENPDNLEEGRFVCIRRANDISQPGSFIPSPQVGKHGSCRYGTHHAEDAAALFQTMNLDLNLFSSALKVNSQYMHVLWFTLKVKEPISLTEVIEKLNANPYVAMTEKDMTSTVFSFGRDQGYFGRILNQTVVVEQTLNVKNDHEITGFCFTPQDGNSILSSVAVAEWFLYPHSYEDKIQCLSEFFYDHI